MHLTGFSGQGVDDIHALQKDELGFCLPRICQPTLSRLSKDKPLGISTALTHQTVALRDDQEAERTHFKICCVIRCFVNLLL